MPLQKRSSFTGKNVSERYQTVALRKYRRLKDLQNAPYQGLVLRKMIMKFEETDVSGCCSEGDGKRWGKKV
ncbi:hypothetical protein TNCV_3174021 [Trichonephila clavipes]|nr:hypothetical protein TNCV_3174021 [Trichonephila clavipes]